MMGILLPQNMLKVAICIYIVDKGEHETTILCTYLCYCNYIEQKKSFATTVAEFRQKATYSEFTNHLYFWNALDPTTSGIDKISVLCVTSRIYGNVLSFDDIDLQII